MTDVRSKIWDDFVYIYCECGMEKLVLIYDEEIDMWDLYFDSNIDLSFWERLKLAFKYLFKGDKIWPCITLRRSALERLKVAIEKELTRKQNFFETFEDDILGELKNIQDILEGIPANMTNNDLATRLEKISNARDRIFKLLKI